MKPIIKALVKSLVPGRLVNWYQNRRGRRVHFVGKFHSWQAVENAAIGYKAEEILQQVTKTTRLVVSGKAAYERDGVAFDKREYPYPLIALLLRAATKNNNKLTVLDFGGSLGSAYYQCRDFLEGVSTLRWCIVEQSHFVAAGNRHFANEVLSFHHSIADSSADYRPDVVLVSGVLQYLPEPYAILEQLIALQCEFIVIDRTPFINEGSSALCLQKVPKSIVEASYPVWLFNEQTFNRIFVERYVEIATFDAIDGTIGDRPLKATFKGVMLQRIK